MGSQGQTRLSALMTGSEETNRRLSLKHFFRVKQKQPALLSKSLSFIGEMLKEPFDNVEETSFSTEAVNHKCPHKPQRKNSIPDSVITKKERKRKSKNVAFITSYNGLILQ